MKNNIKELREKAGLSMQRLGDAAGTTAQQINNLEKGKRKLTWDWMTRLATPLGCRPEDIVAEDLEEATAEIGDFYNRNVMERILVLADETISRSKIKVTSVTRNRLILDLKDHALRNKALGGEATVDPATAESFLKRLLN